MLALAIECSTARASISIKKDSVLLHHESSNNPKTHSEFLNVATEKSLQIAGVSLDQIDIFACSSGPGSFTGIRVASSIVKTFAMLYKKPLFVTNSLHILAAQAYKKDPSLKQILCLINAHKNMVYAAFYDQKNELLAPSALKLEDLPNIPQLRQALGLGDAFAFYGPSIETLLSEVASRDSDHEDFPDAATLCDLALEALKQGKTIEWNLYKPLYIRDSEAEEVLKGKNSDVGKSLGNSSR